MENLLVREYSVTSIFNSYYAYGIRNSFGIGFDPINGNLWDTENGPRNGDEINLLEPGFNSGWDKVQGIWKFNEKGKKMDYLMNPVRHHLLILMVRENIANQNLYGTQLWDPPP
jgi:hypothetical protein